ncbi:hypothetical protein COBT_001371 [Conglomerata obtusa]
MDLNYLIEITSDYKIALLTSLLYIIYSIKTNNSLKNTTPPSRNFFSFLTLTMTLHNIILCIFSLTVFISTAPIIYTSFKDNNLISFMKDRDKTMQNQLHFWIWLFYISKIYEIVDSLILHWNKRPTSFLQMYHHAGAIICCWMLVRCDTHLPWIFVVLNSFIHTLMYFYYLLTTLKIGVPRFYKRLITRMQIVQFVSGSLALIIHFAVGIEFSKERYMFWFQYGTMICNLVYVGVLFGLFRRFEKETYKKIKKE